MKKKTQQQNDSNSFQQNSDKNAAYFKHEPSQQWQFQKVQSVYKIKRQLLNNQQVKKQEIISQSPYKMDVQTMLNKYPDRPKYQSNLVSSKNHRKNEPNLFNLEQRLAERLSSQTKNKAKQMSPSRSIQYLSSQEPSFSNKGQFTVLQDFNLENQFVNNKNQQHLDRDPNGDWRIVSFAPKNAKKFAFKQKCHKIFQSLQQLKFLKEGFQSKLKQQQNCFKNEIQEVKKLLFKLHVKYEKQMLEFTKNSQQSRLSSSRISMQSESKENQFIELKMYCKRLEEQKLRSQQKYSSTLKKYQQQIEIISEQLLRKISNKSQQNLPSFQNPSLSCQNCMKLQEILQNYMTVEKQLQKWKNRYNDQQKRYNLQLRKAEQEISILNQNLAFLQKNKIQTQRKLKQKQRQILYEQSEIEFKMKQIEKRQKDLQRCEIILKRQKDEMEAQKQKISDYQFKVIKEEKIYKNQQKATRQFLSSEYFSNNVNEKRSTIMQRDNPFQRNDSISSKGSRIDINARLREIQIMKGNRNQENSFISRNSSKDSHYSGLKDYGSSRFSNSTKNLNNYGISSPPLNSKDYKRQSSQSIKLSQKLSKLTETIQKQLREIQ